MASLDAPWVAHCHSRGSASVVGVAPLPFQLNGWCLGRSNSMGSTPAVPTQWVVPRSFQLKGYHPCPSNYNCHPKCGKHSLSRHLVPTWFIPGPVPTWFISALGPYMVYPGTCAYMVYPGTWSLHGLSRDLCAYMA